MWRTVSATEARVHFGELMRRIVEDGEIVTVERGGTPRVVILSVEEYERLGGLTNDRTKWWSELHELHELIRAELGDRPLEPPPEEVIRQMREERDAQIDAAVWGLSGCEPGGTSDSGTSDGQRPAPLGPVAD